jgi:hypothetical protein
MYDLKQCCRTKVMIPIVLPSEALAEFFLGHTDAVADGDLHIPLPGSPSPPMDELAPAHLESEVCRISLALGIDPSRVRRLGIFMDAAGFTKNESFEGLFINDLATGKRFLIAVIRKAELCGCGCRVFAHFGLCMMPFCKTSRVVQMADGVS